MPSKYDGEFVYEGDEDIPYGEYIENAASVKRTLDRQKAVKSVNEVGVIPELPPEVYEERKKYREDLCLALQELFPESSGLKPFGKVQIDSIKFLQYIMHNFGRLVMLEPRAYAKTTRITNAVTMCALEGVQPYVVIVTSSLAKSQDILEDIRTELTTNDHLKRLYPATCACFNHLARSPQKTKRQTYGGNFTYIQNSQDAIHFPSIPGEPSSGCIIQVRPATNLKGLKHKIESGPRKGQNQRPTLYVFDDPQTEDDAASAPMRRKIIKNIKRSALKGGTHQNPVSAVMAVTPVEYGDVPWHFVHKEESFDLVRYKMIEKMPDNEAIWYGEYANIRGNFNREKRGDRTRARKEAAQFVRENYDEMHKGAVWTWDYAFNPNAPQYEVSPLQHAFNIILDDGIEDFEFECQCNTEYGMYEETDKMHCPTSDIIKKTNSYARGIIPQSTYKIVTHIDVNQEVMSYVTICSDKRFRPFVIDYGTFPEQPGRFGKRKLAIPLSKMYPESSDYRERLYLGLLDLLQYLALKRYIREDGIQKGNDVIGVDIRFEEVYLSRACRETPFSSLVLPCWGTFIGPDDDPLHQRSYQDSVNVYENAVEVPNKDHTLDILKVDVNFFKTEVHKALNRKLGIEGSLSLWDGNHLLWAEHHNSEFPKRVPGKQEIRTKILWKGKADDIDNEYFDNSTGCFALLVREGIDLNTKKQKSEVGARVINVLEDLMNKPSTTNVWGDD